MKKIVNFSGKPEFYQQDIGVVPKDLLPYATGTNITLAWVYALNHPRLGRQNVRTSVVTKRYKNGNFDTLNTQYKKVLDKKQN